MSSPSRSPTNWKATPCCARPKSAAGPVRRRPQHEEQVRTLIEATSDLRECAARVAEDLSRILHLAGLSSSFEEIVALGLFNYEKYPMVRDLQESSELLATSKWSRRWPVTRRAPSGSSSPTRTRYPR